MTSTALLIFVVGAAWAFRRIDFTISTFIDGLGDMQRLASRMWPPRPDDLGRSLRQLLETFTMAVAGTAIAACLSAPLGFLAARNTTPHPLVAILARGIIVFTRAIPDIVFAIIFVMAMSIGPKPGILAMGLHSIGMLGKLLADAIEEIDEGPREAALSAGATSRQALANAVVPQVLPSFASTILYRLDINVRTSVILGLVGAGGIGFELQATLNTLRYRAALGIILLIFALILVVERLSILVRAMLFREATGNAAKAGGHRFAAPSKPMPLAAAHRSVTSDRLSPPWTGSRISGTAVSLGLALGGALCLYSVHLGPLEIARAIPDIWSAITRFFPPDVSTFREQIVVGLIETIALALAGFAVGVLLALPVGFLAARNTSPNRAIYRITRFLLVLVRGIPEFIIALLFVSAVGLGPFAGAMTVVVFTLGFLAKLFADAIEEVGPGAIEGVRATGATRLQETVSAVVPQAMSSLVGNALYGLDVNIRSSSVLGLVGAGGIGFLLSETSRSLEYRTTGGILLCLFLIVFALELVSGRIRKVLR